MTLAELSTLIFLVSAATLAGHFATDRFGGWAGIAAGVLVFVGCMGLSKASWYALERKERQRQVMLREKYRGLYRVLALPAEAEGMRLAPESRIVVGDYGWEAEPLRDNGHIYLQGLTETWGVAWYAGFEPEQVEYVGEKPVSQYDYRQHRHTKLECPFPAQAPGLYHVECPN